MKSARQLRSGGDYSHPILREITRRLTQRQTIAQIARELDIGRWIVSRYIRNFDLIARVAKPPQRKRPRRRPIGSPRSRRKRAKLSPEERSASYSARNRLRWQNERQRLIEIVTRNARKGTAVLTGRKYTPERSRRASLGQRGKMMGGRGAKGPAHYFAKGFSLRAPDTAVYRGENILDFVRANTALFDPTDVVMKNGTCRAAKALCRLRPGAVERRASWKGWQWHKR